MKKILYLTLMVALGLVSCKSTVVEEQSAKGSLSFNITELGDYITVDTRAGVDYTDLSNYDVVIDGPDKLSEKYSTFRGRVVELGSGHYTITVTSPDTEPAAFEQPIYQGRQEFDIRPGEVTDIKMDCVPMNTKVTIELTENFKKELATYEVVISNGLGSLTWTKDKVKDDFAHTKAGYFLPRGLEIKVKGHRSIDDIEANAVDYVKNPMAAEHHIIKLDADVTGQIGGVTIKVVTEFNEKSDSINVGGLDETYVDRPDFDGSEGDYEEENNAPSISWPGNPFFDPYDITPTSDVRMTISAPAGLKTFVVEVSDNFKAAIKMVSGGPEYIDLINDADVWSVIPNLPVGDQVKDQTVLEFALTPFVSTLCSAAGGMTVDFILKATDNNDNPVLVDGAYPVVTLNVPN